MVVKLVSSKPSVADAVTKVSVLPQTMLVSIVFFCLGFSFSVLCFCLLFILVFFVSYVSFVLLVALFLCFLRSCFSLFRIVLHIVPMLAVVPQFGGWFSGGFLAAMLDSVTAAPILASLPEELTVVTTELRVQYERPAQLGELFGCGRISSRDDREVHSEGELADPAGDVVARATATFRLVRPR